MHVVLDDRVRSQGIGVVDLVFPGCSVTTASTGEVWQSVDNQITSVPLVISKTC